MNFGPVAGIDVSKRFSDMCILSPDNKIFAQEKIYHDETSINRANTLLQKAEQIFSSKPVIVMESTSHYHLILFQFFSEHGYDVIVVNPLQSSSMKDFSIRKRKTDRVDAFKLAMMYRTKTLRPSQVPQTALRALRQLCRERVEFLNDVSSYKNRLTAFLDQAFPGYDKVFSDLGGITSCAVLVRFPTPAILLAAEDAELVEVIAAASKSGYGFAKKKAELLISAAQKAQTLGIHSCADETLIVCTIQMLRTLSESVFQIEKAIDNLLAQMKEIRNNVSLLQSIPGIGSHSAALLLGEIGDFTLFKKPKQLAAYFGLDPSERQSGTFRGTKNKISKRGSPYACKNRHPSPICTRFEHHFHALKPHLHRRSFSDTLPENQRHLIALKRHPLWHMQKLCQLSQPAELRSTFCQDVLQLSNPLALSLEFFLSCVKVFHRLTLHLVVAGPFQF